MLTGKSVVLGPILPIDLTRLFQWGDDPEIARLNEPYLPKNVDRERDFWLNANGDPRRQFFAVRLRTSPDIIGHVQIIGIEQIHRSASVGLLIGNPALRGKGYGRDAMELAIEFCWRHLNLTRLSLSVHSDNHNAVALYEKLGFETEGLLRKAQFIDGRWIDLKLMALVDPNR